MRVIDEDGEICIIIEPLEPALYRFQGRQTCGYRFQLEADSVCKACGSETVAYIVFSEKSSFYGPSIAGNFKSEIRSGDIY